MTKAINDLTLGMIKPHAVRARKAGEIITRIENAGFAILNVKAVQLRKEGAALFYEEHKGKDFFPNLVNIMSSGTVWALVLAKQNAVEEFRKLIGATHPAEAEPGTIRHDYGDHSNITLNAIHGSANPEDSYREILFFFGSDLEKTRRCQEMDKQAKIS